jgi:hypothetical protein
MLALAVVAPACSSGVDVPPGFSIAYMAPGADGGTATDADADAATDADAAADAATDGEADAGASADAETRPAFRSIAGSGAGYAWAVGDLGMSVHLGGSTWTPVPTGTTATLGGLSVLDVGHVFAVELGGARVLAFDARGWAPLGADRAGRAAAATFALAPNNVWVAGDGIEHWDGRAWTQQVPGGARFTSLFGSFNTDVWAAGPGGIQHYDGHAWTALTPPADAGAIAGVWVSALYDAWLVGAKGTVVHWNGNVLTLLPTMTNKDLTAIAGTVPGDVWVGGEAGTLLHWDGAQWTSYLTPARRTITDLWAALDDQIFFVDDTGAVTRFNP